MSGLISAWHWRGCESDGVSDERRTDLMAVPEGFSRGHFSAIGRWRWQEERLVVDYDAKVVAPTASMFGICNLRLGSSRIPLLPTVSVSAVLVSSLG